VRHPQPAPFEAVVEPVEGLPHVPVGRAERRIQIGGDDRPAEPLVMVRENPREPLQCGIRSRPRSKRS